MNCKSFGGVSMGDLKVRNFIRIGNDEPVLFDSLSAEEQKRFGILLNAHALSSIGYAPDKKKLDAALKQFDKAEKPA